MNLAASPANTVQANLRFLRIVHATLLFSMILYPIISERMLQHDQASLSPVWWPAFLIVSAGNAAIAVWFRATWVRPAVETLRVRPDDAASRQRWRAGSIVSAVLFESIVLLGFALRVLGGTFAHSMVFYAAGIALMLIYWPQNP